MTVICTIAITILGLHFVFTAILRFFALVFVGSPMSHIFVTKLAMSSCFFLTITVQEWVWLLLGTMIRQSDLGSTCARILICAIYFRSFKFLTENKLETGKVSGDKYKLKELQNIRIEVSCRTATLDFFFDLAESKVAVFLCSILTR